MSTQPGLQALVAMSADRVIGCNGNLPWHLPDDFRWFKQKTMGGTLVMGRKTFESIGKPLPGRHNVVLTRDPTWSFPNIEVIHELDCVSTDRWSGDVFVIGGATIYAALLPHCTDVFLTQVHATYPGDTFLPAFEHLFPAPSRIFSTPAFDILHYCKRSPRK